MINYQKRKNIELFKRFEEPSTLFLSKPQNYIPIYSRFFNVNETNYNSINLNNKWYISNIEGHEKDNENNEDNEDKDDYNDNIFMCRLKNVDTNKVKDKPVFFKLAPLLDPYKYMTGKYDISNPTLFHLPKLNSTADECNPKFIDVNNSAYVDGLFLFLSSQLKHVNKFTHGVDYYGSFLALKNDYKINVFDDIDYLVNSDFFNKNKNVLFKIDDFDHLFQEIPTKLKPLTIGNNISLKSLKSVDNELFDDVFDENNTLIDLNELKDLSLDLIDVTQKSYTLKSNSTCSSRSSHTNDEDLDELCEHCDNDNDDYNDNDNNNNNEIFESSSEKNKDSDDEGDWEDIEDDDDDDEEDEDEEEQINVTIPKFPVQVIGMEFCENTFDDLILNNELTTEEWQSAFMQIIMTLIVYQKAFNFTHNDLHTNNVMYIPTDKKFLYYCYKKKYYKVPTFGKIFKIIDFGRSIFKFNGKVFCSDSFQNGGDAATQYNTEPYFNDKKPRLEPNYSFDLCRLACSIFDYIIEDYEEIKDLSKIKDPVKKLVFEWCLDDKGINMLYKNNGTERYPDFKLYKMIARCVHNHTPQAQLERPEFDAFSKYIGEIKNMDEVINIDNISSHI
jgi:hypothetical protein